MRQQWFEPGEKCAVCAIAFAEPDNGRSIGFCETAFDEILIFRDNCPTSCRGKVPDTAVVGIAQAQLSNWTGCKAAFTEPAARAGGSCASTRKRMLNY